MNVVLDFLVGVRESTMAIFFFAMILAIQDMIVRGARLEGRNQLFKVFRFSWFVAMAISTVLWPVLTVYVSVNGAGTFAESVTEATSLPLSNVISLVALSWSPLLAPWLLQLFIKPEKSQ